MKVVTRPLTRLCFPLAITGGVAGVVDFFSQAPFGWITFGLLLALQHLLHAWRFAQLDRWTRNPTVDTSLEAKGAWDVVFSRLYHHEKALRQQIEHGEYNTKMLRAAVQALTDGVVLLDLQNHIVFCNETAERMLGLQLNADRGQPLINLLRQPEFVDYIEQESFSHPLTFRPERYKDRIYTAYIIPYAGSRRLLQIKDVTQAERIDETRRDFVANVSHELRTPLTVITGFLETLSDLSLSADEQKNALELMLTQSRRMQSIVQDLLTLSALESAPLPENDVVPMEPLIQQLQRDAELLSNGKHQIIVKMEQRAAQKNLRGSEAELTSAFSNLITNAVRYTPAGGTITLSWDVSTQGASFSVCDTGLGIAPEQLPRLTERFYRADRGRSRDAGGTGLGLAIAKHAITRHQGQLEIKSVLGTGSCFVARFPSHQVMQC